MNRLLLFIMAFPFSCCGQANVFPATADLERVYSQAITDFIRDVNKNKRIDLDTLFFRKRTDQEEPEDNFPDIQLPESIENVHIRLIQPVILDKQQKELKARVCINMLGWVDSKKARFDLFVFSNGFEYKLNYHMEYTYNSKRKEFGLTKLRSQGPPFDK